MAKIFFFNTVNSWGGGEKWHFEMAKFLKSKNHDIVVCTNKNSELSKKVQLQNIQNDQFKFHNLSFLNPFVILKLYLKFKKEKPDILIMNAPIDIKTGGFSAYLAGVPTILYRRGSAIPIKNSFLNRFYFKNVITDVLANSEETKNTIVANNKRIFSKDKIKVIYNGLKIENFKPLESGPNSKFVIGNLGRIVYQKNQKALIDLAVLLKDSIQDFEIRIGGDGRLLDELKQYAEEKKVTNFINFKGFVEDPLAFINTIDIFVLTSHWEGFGYVIAEASLLEKAVVAFDVSSNPEIIVEGETGYLVAKDDIEALKEKVLFLYENSEKRTELGKAGRAYAMQNFDSLKNAQLVEDYLLALNGNGTQERVKLSVVIPTFNEAHNIDEVLKSVDFADEIMVVDSFSTDNTVELARKYTDFIIQREYVHSASQKNWAIPQATHEWILLIDADERVSPELKAEVIAILKNPPTDNTVGFWIGRVNCFMRKRVKYGEWRGDKVIRLFRKSKCKYEDIHVHSEIIAEGEIGFLKEKLFHNTYISLDHYIEKKNRYAWHQAEDYNEKVGRLTAFHFFVKPCWRFFRQYIIKLGFLDGVVGLTVAYLQSYAVFMRYVKLWLLRRNSL